MKKSNYSSQQLLEYLRYVNFSLPPGFGLEAFRPTDDNLHRIFYLHKLAFPFENTAFHYEKDLSGISAEEIFTRAIREGRGLGSHCCGLNTLLLHVLLGLGYRAHAGLGQFNRAPLSSSDVLFGPRTHMILFVRSKDSSLQYLVDAGGGTVGVVYPIPMYNGATVQGASTPEEHKLVQISSQSGTAELSSRDPQGYDWQLEMRCGTHIPSWRVLFRFSSLPVDTAAIQTASRLLLSPQGDASFQKDIFCVRYFRLGSCDLGEHRTKRGEAMDDLGRLVLTGNKISRRIGDKCEVVVTLTTESEKRTALRDLFGMKIDYSKTLDGLQLCPS